MTEVWTELQMPTNNFKPRSHVGEDFVFLTNVFYGATNTDPCLFGTMSSKQKNVTTE